MTFLEMVNDILERLREDTVATIADSAYSKLIGKFINDTKREVERAFGWDTIRISPIVTTSSGVATYVVTGSGRSQHKVTINDTTNYAQLINVPRQWITDQNQLTNIAQTGTPSYYCWDGNNGVDSQITLFPIPNGTYSLKCNMYVVLPALTIDSDVISVDPDLVIAGAYARAVVERGEEGGLQSSEAYHLFRSQLSDAVALEAARYIENDHWEAV